MKVIVNEDRKIKVACMNKSGTQNENKATELELQVPTEFEDYNKKIVFVTDDGIVWDIIQDNTYKLTKAITKYKQVNFYIWLTKGDVDFRSKTMPLRFYHNEDASDEITPEEIHGVNTVVNLLEEEIEKVENLNIEATKIGNTTTVTITKKDGTTESVEINDGTDGQDGQDGYTPQKGIDYFTEQDIEEIETDVKEDVLDEVYTKTETDTLLQEKADVEDIPDVSNFITKDVNNLTNYTLKTNTGSLIDLEINDTTYVVTLKLKNQDGTIISTDTIDLPLESVVVSGRYDNTTKKVILTLENGSEVDFSVADLVAGLQTEITSQNKLASDLIDDTNSGNKFTNTSEKSIWNGKYDKPSGGIPKTDLASDVQTSLGKADTAIQEHQDISGKEDKANKVISISSSSTDTQYPSAKCVYDSQEEQNTEIEKLQTENARFKATLPTTGEVTGQNITLDKTAEFEFIKPPLPMGNSEQVQYSGKNLFNYNVSKTGIIYNINNDIFTFYRNTGSDFLIPFNELKLKTNTNYVLYMNIIENTMTSNFVLVTSASVFLQGSFSIGIGQTGIKTAEVSTASSIDNLLYDLWFYCNGSGSLKANVMLVEGTTQGDYEPYVGGTASPNPDYPQEITNVTGDVEVVVENKNLFDWNKVVNPSLDVVNGTLNETLSNGIIVTGDISSSTDIGAYSKGWFRPGDDNTNKGCKINTTQNSSVIISADVTLLQLGYSNKMRVYLNGTNNFISGTEDSLILNQKIRIYRRFDNVPKGTYYPIFTLSSNKVKIENIQIEQNTVATEYIEHKEQTFTFPLGNEKLMLGDYLAYDGIHHKTRELNLAIADMDNGEDFPGWTNLSQLKTDYPSINSSFTAAGINYKSNISNEAYRFNLNTLHEGVMFLPLSKWGNIKQTQWKTNYPNLILKFQYELKEEEVVPYTSAQQEVYNQIKQALSYEEQTNISSNQNALFSVEAYQDAKVILAEKYVKPDTGIPKTDLASAVQTSLGKADTALQEHQDISGKQDITDNTLTTINKTVPTAINEVNSIAKLANQAKSYSTYQAFINYLNTAEKTEFIPGQSFMIQTKLVPDLWVYSVENTSVQYTYTTDEDFITYTNQATGGQVGYYKLAQLETQKVDLTNYVTFDDYATSTTAGVVKTNSMYGVSTSSYTQNITATTKTYDQYQSSNNATFVGKGTLENVITGKNLESANNKTTTISSSSTDNEYPSAKAVYDYIQSILNNGSN